MAVDLKLSKPVQAHGEVVTALTLREATGKDLRTAGLPYKLGADGGIAIDAGNMGKMIAQLAAVPTSTVDLLAAPDWNAAAMVVLGFITGSAETPASQNP
jgi:hypothetical protein